jgi:hypothetical protein
VHCSINLSTHLSKGFVFVTNLAFIMTPLGFVMILGICPRVQTMKLSMKSNNRFSEFMLKYKWLCEMLVLKSHMDYYLNNLVNVTLSIF